MTELPKIVAQRLNTKAKAEPHPDPDLLAAFIERSLELRERSLILEHLSQCADCREVVSLSAPEEGGRVSAPVVARAPWLSWPVLRWGALAACVVVVGAAVTLHYRSRSNSQFTETAKQVEVHVTGEAKAAPQLPAPATFDKLATATGVAKPPQSKKDVGAPAVRLRAEARTPSSPSSAANAATAGSLSKLMSAPADMSAKKAEVAVAAESLNPVTGNEVAEVVPGRAKDAESAQADNEPAPIAGSAGKQKAAATSLMTAKALPAAQAKLVPRWTLTSDGTLQRSLDSGRTWQTILLNSQATFRALAANGLDIWVGGSGGTLFHSSDAGQHWTQVQPVVNGGALTADIIGVEFTDLLHGTVTTSSKETWITDDAGQNWRKK